MKKLVVLISLTGLMLMFTGCNNDKKDQGPADVMSEILNDSVGEVLQDVIQEDMIQEDMIQEDMEILPQDVIAEEMIAEITLEVNLPELISDVVDELPSTLDVVSSIDVTLTEEVMTEVSE
jgi:hypothetical protein